MSAALGVLERDAVFFAGAAAVAVAGALREEAAEDAVFGVEHGQVLVGDGFYILWADGEGERGYLRGVQFVGGG